MFDSCVAQGDTKASAAGKTGFSDSGHTGAGPLLTGAPAWAAVLPLSLVLSSFCSWQVARPSVLTLLFVGLLWKTENGNDLIKNSSLPSSLLPFLPLPPFLASFYYLFKL